MIEWFVSMLLEMWLLQLLFAVVPTDFAANNLILLCYTRIPTNEWFVVFQGLLTHAVCYSTISQFEIPMSESTVHIKHCTLNAKRKQNKRSHALEQTFPFVNINKHWPFPSRHFASFFNVITLKYRHRLHEKSYLISLQPRRANVFWSAKS